MALTPPELAKDDLYLNQNVMSALQDEIKDWCGLSK
jgi:hypothetical protein